MDLKKFFNEDDFSDVTVKVGDDDVKCHKIVLSSQSEYLADMIKKAEATSEGSPVEIRLRGGPQFRVHAILRYLYTFDYEDAESKDDWMEQIEFAEMADWYGITKLKEKALARFKKLVMRETNLECILDILKRLKGPDGDRAFEEFAENNLQDVISELEAKHGDEFVREPKFVAMSNNWTAMQGCLQNMPGYWLRRCRSCGAQRVLEERCEDAICCVNEDPFWERCWLQG